MDTSLYRTYRHLGSNCDFYKEIPRYTVMGMCSSLCRPYILHTYVVVLNVAGSTARHTCHQDLDPAETEWSTHLGFGHLLGATEDPVNSEGLCKKWREHHREGNGCNPDVQLYTVCTCEGGGREEGKERRGEEGEKE